MPGSAPDRPDERLQGRAEQDRQEDEQQDVARQRGHEREQQDEADADREAGASRRPADRFRAHPALPTQQPARTRGSDARMVGRGRLARDRLRGAGPLQFRRDRATGARRGRRSAVLARRA